MALDRGELRAPEVQPRPGDQLKRLQADVLQLAPARLEPGRLGAGEQAAVGDIERHLGERPCRPGVLAVERVPRPLDLRGGRFQVDPHRLGQVEQQLVAALERTVAERGAQTTEQRPQCRVLGDGRLMRPQRPDQLLPPDRPSPVEQQVGEQQRHLFAAQRPSQLRAIDLYGQPSA